MSGDFDHNNSHNWQDRYAEQRAHNNVLQIDDNSSNSSFNFNLDDELRDSHYTQYLTDNQEEITKVSHNYISPMSNGESTYLDQHGKTTGLETINALDNVELGNAALAYVVGRHELAPSASQIELKLTDSQAIDNVRRKHRTFMSVDSSQDKSSGSNHRFSYYQTKTPSTGNFSHYGNNSDQNPSQTHKNNHHSSTSDLTVSTHILFDSPESQKVLSEKAKPTYYNNSSSSSGSLRIKKKAVKKNEEVLDKNENMFVGYYKNYNATEPLPPQSQSNTNILEQGNFEKENYSASHGSYNFQQPQTNRSFSNSDNSLASNNSANPLLSMKIQKASHQRKTKKGHILNTKHMSIYQYQKPNDVYTNGNLKKETSNDISSSEVFISKNRLDSVLKLTLTGNLCWKYILPCLLIPILGPILIVFLDNATFLKLCICKEKTLQEIDYIEENPYSTSKNGFHNGYSTMEIGYFGIISLWLEHEISSSSNNKAAKQNSEKNEDLNREKKVGFKDTTSVINFPVDIIDPICVDVDYTRLKYYLNNLHYADGNIKSEFLRTCLEEWESFLYRVRLITCLYSGLWLILSILCIILILVLKK